MGNENMRDLTAADLEIDHLDLCAFATIYKIIVAIKCHYLAGRMTVKSWYCGVISKDRYSKHGLKYELNRIAGVK